MMPKGWRRLTPHEMAGEDKTRLVIGPFGSNLKTSDYRTTGVPLVFVRDIRVGRFDRPRHFVSPDKADELRSHLVRQGDVLVTKMGDPPGDACVYTGTTPAIITADCIRLTPAAQVDARFISYALQAPEVRQQIESITSGVAQRKVSLARFRTGISLPVPPLDLQRRIVDVIESHFTRLNAALKAIEDSLARLDAMRDSALAEAVTAATRDPCSSTRPLGELAKVATGMTPLRSNEAFYGGGSIPWITSGDLHQGFITRATHFVTQKALDETSLKVVPAGALLVAMYGEGKTRGTAATLGIDATTNQACASVVLTASTLVPWVKLVLDANYSALRRLGAGGVQPNLNLSIVRALEIPIPSASKRSFLLSRMAEMEESGTRLRKSLLAAQQRGLSLRKSLLAAALSGRLTGDAPSHQELQEIAG